MNLFKKIKIILLVVMLLYPINFTYAQSTNDIISNIKIEGNQRVEIDTIYSYLNISIGEQFDIDKLNNSLKNLYSTGFFSDVNIIRDGNIVIVQVLENPIINRVVLKVIKKLKMMY